MRCAAGRLTPFASARINRAINTDACLSRAAGSQANVADRSTWHLADVIRGRLRG